MKTICWFFVAAVAFSGAARVLAAPLQATVTLKTGRVTAGYVTGAESDGVMISLQPDGGGAFKVPNDQIADINMDEPKGWSAALATFTAGRYADAEGMFSKLADEFDPLVPLQDSYGSLSRLYHFRSLKQLGKLQDLSSAIDRQLANPLALGDFYRSYFDDIKGWAILGKEDWLALGSYVQSYEQEQLSSSLAQKPFQKLPESRLAALCFLRASWHESQGNPEMALTDYNRAVTYNFGSDRSLRSKAMAASLRILAAKLEKKPTDKALRQRAHATAIIYRDLVGAGEVAEAYKPLLEKPSSEDAAPAAKTEGTGDAASN
jgi:hypothetical protein